MKSLFKLLLLFLAVLLFHSCYTKRETTLLQEKGMPQYAKAEYEPYRIKINDELLLRVTSLNPEVASLFNFVPQQSSSSNSFRVYSDSTIDIPYVSRIKIAGLTLREAQAEIEKELKGYGSGITVRLALNNSFFTVIGEAGRGNFNLDKEKISIYEALAMAGDINITGQYKAVHIIRETATGTQIYTFDIRSKSVIDSEFYYIQPNDIIYVDRKKSSFLKVNSYSSVLGVVSSLITFSLTIWNLVVNLK